MKIEILLVDDDRIFNLLHTRFFEKVGVEKSLLKSFRTGEECLAYLDDQNNVEERLFLVLLDISMPVMDGWDFLELLRERDYRSSIQVIMVSSSVDGADKERAMKYDQVVDYIEKPLSPRYIDGMKNNKELTKLFNGGDLQK